MSNSPASVNEAEFQLHEVGDTQTINIMVEIMDRVAAEKPVDFQGVPQELLDGQLSREALLSTATFAILALTALWPAQPAAGAVAEGAAATDG